MDKQAPHFQVFCPAAASNRLRAGVEQPFKIDVQISPKNLRLNYLFLLFPDGYVTAVEVTLITSVVSLSLQEFVDLSAFMVMAFHR